MTNKPTVRICCSRELIRLHLINNDYRGNASVREDSDTIVLHTITYDIAPGVVSKLIADRWLIPSNWSGEFELDPDLEEEWWVAENDRIIKARSILEERFGKGKFDDYPTWDVYHHPASPNLDSRGFVFTDPNGYKYLVCEGGSVMPLLKQLINN